MTLTANTLYEYSKDGTAWQADNVFSGLTPSTAYTFYQRLAETGDTEASPSSPALNVMTDAAPVIVIPDPDPYDPTVYVTGVCLNHTKLEGKAGGAFRLVATITPTYATNQDVTWSTSNPSVATVDYYGLVNFIGAGKAKITVTTVDGSYTATCLVTVSTATGTEGIDATLKVYLRNHILYVSSPTAETVEVYSFNVAKLFNTKKDAGEATFTVPMNLKAVIVRGSSGWTLKAINN